MSNISNLTKPDALQVAILNGGSHKLVWLGQMAGNMTFRHFMTADKARELATQLFELANEIDAVQEAAA